MDAVLKPSPYTEIGSGGGVAGRGLADSSPSLSSGGQQSLLLNSKYPKVIDLDQHPGLSGVVLVLVLKLSHAS